MCWKGKLLVALAALLIFALGVTTAVRAFVPSPVEAPPAGAPPSADEYRRTVEAMRPARDIADNYNHLMEQPTIFYALVFYTHLAGNGDLVSVALAWGYVAFRFVHTVIRRQ